MRYQWYIQPNDGELTEVFPIYKDDLALNYERETGQMFFREKLSGKLTFVGTDFEFIMSQDFETTFWLFCKRNGNDYHKCKFFFTDCEINFDDKKIEVQTQVTDQYDSILDNYEKELDLLQQNVATENITYKKRPMIQVYIKGEDVASCLIGNTCWEQNVKEATTNFRYLQDTCHFVLNTLYKEITYIKAGGSDAMGAYSGRCTNNGTDPLEERNFFADDMREVYGNVTAYKITCQQWSRVVTPEEGSPYIENNNIIQLIRISDSAVIDSYSLTTEHNYDDIEPFESGEYTGVNGGVFTLRSKAFYARYVCDVETIEGVGDTYVISEDDLIENNRNYHRCIGYRPAMIGYVNYLLSDTPTKYGRYGNKYYMPPGNIAIYYPCARSAWDYGISYWLRSPDLEHVYEEKAQADITLRDAIPLHAVISALLAEFAPDVTFEPTAEYSVFLYQNFGFALYLTQKTNILVAQYTQEAQKGTITLRDVLEMLRKCFNAYWFIEDGKLRIEHIHFFENGGSYTDTPTDYIDLTAAENVRNGKKWAFGQGKITFDKEDMPAQIKYAWMDDVSDVFAGQPIEIVSQFVQKDKIEEVNISNFTSDVDKMLLLPSDFSQDGWALLGAVDNVLPIVTISVGLKSFYLQNGYLSMTYLQPEFLRHDLPAPYVKINGEDTYALSVSRKRKQQVSFPMPTPKPDTNKTIKTSLGSGEIDTLSVTLLSNFAKGTIKFPTI